VMGTWVLILTLLAPATSGGSSVGVVSGFHSNVECQVAGNLWLANVPNAWSKASAVCVSTAPR
jgi:hypothetical protein